MGIIRQLPPHEAQKVAAGEVVERPANIAKELIENAIDAGSTRITVTIEDGGKLLLRVADDGCGMDADDAHSCFERHATSKLTTIHELEHIQTFGFRGEALASIAAVAKITLRTRHAQDASGTCVTIDEQGRRTVDPIAQPVGTDISVEDLFCTIPARKKFLKKRETESRQITQLMHAFCLSYPHIHFKLISEGSLTLNCPPTKNNLERCTQLWTHQTPQQLLSISGIRQDKGVHIAGIISNHQTFRYERGGIFFFVNNRWVTHRTLTRALLDGYQNVLPHGRFPLASLHITVDPTQVDINVHPRKEEVSFLHPRVVEKCISDAVKAALEDGLSKHLKRDVSLTPAQSTSYRPFSYTPPDPAHDTFASFDFDAHPLPVHTPESFINSNPRLDEDVSRMDHQYNEVVHKNKNVEQPLPLAQPLTAEQPLPGSELVAPSQTTLDSMVQETYHPPRIIGQCAQTYILIDHPDGLFMIDQHAAHECILYELFETRFQHLPTIPLLFPQTITLSSSDCKLVAPYLDLLRDNGIGIELLGAEQLTITTLPTHLKDAPIHELVHELIGWIKETDHAQKKDITDALHKKLRAQMACKAAVKAGDTLTQEKMEQLVRDLEQCKNNLTCPHGRPTGWLLSEHEIEKRFKRKK